MQLIAEYPLKRHRQLANELIEKRSQIGLQPGNRMIAAAAQE